MVPILAQTQTPPILQHILCSLAALSSLFQSALAASLIDIMILGEPSRSMDEMLNVSVISD